MYAMEYYLAIKRIVLPFEATRENLELIILSEVNQKQKGKYHMVSFNELIYRTDSQP